MTTTKPTTISTEQYAKAYIAHNPETFDMFLVWQDETGTDCCLWVGQDKRSTENSDPAVNDDCYTQGLWLTNEAGYEYWCNDAFCCKTKDCLADINLSALADGRIKWI